MEAIFVCLSVCLASLCFFPLSSPSVSFQIQLDHHLLEDILCECILPAFSLFQSNPVLSSELWTVLRLLTYQERYTLYGFWKEQAYAKFPEVRE